jgi:DNA-binding transcriptional ArsR family regulator
VGRGIGRALEKAVSGEAVDAELETQGPSLANARRRQVFRYLCLRPCARVGDVGRDLAMSQATVRWHAWDLVEKGFLQVEGSRVFPVGLIDLADAALFSALASTGRAAVLAASFASPGISLQELSDRVHLTRQSVSKIAIELSEFGVLSLDEDGRFRRVHPTDLLVRKREANGARVAAFGEALIRRLSEEGLSPELLRKDERTLRLRFGAGPRRVLLEVPIDPYATAWMRSD